MLSLSSQGKSPAAAIDNADDPLAADFEEVTARLLLVPTEEPGRSSLHPMVIYEARQVHLVGHHQKDGLPPYAFYEDAYGYRASEPETDADNGHPWQMLDPKDKPYRMRWTPHNFYRWLIASVSKKHRALYNIDEISDKVQSYTEFVLGTTTQDTEPTHSDSKSLRDGVPVAEITIPTITTCSFLHLPSELHCEIVLLAREDDFFTPFTVSQVSHFLRAVALECTLLWTTIDVMYGLERAAVQLQRSCKAPLTVRASIAPMFSFDHSMAINNRFIALLSNHFTRIAYLEATFVSPVLLEMFFSHILSVPERLPLLHKVIFGLVNRRSRSLGSKGIPFAEAGAWEALTSFTLLGVRGEIQPCLPIGLVELCLEKVKGVHLLKFCRSLQTMNHTLQKFSMVDSTFTTPPSEEANRIGVVNLVHLETLDINRLHGKDVDEFRKMLITPNLKSLSYSLITSKQPDWTNSYLLHVARNCPRLRVLVLTGCGLEFDTWKALGDGLCELVKLHLCWCTLRPHDMLAFSGINSDTHEQDVGALPYPSLSELILDNEIYLGSSDVVGLLKARSSFRGESSSTIHSLIMRGWDKTLVDDNDVWIIQQLVGRFVLTVFDAEESESSDSSSGGDGGWDSTADWNSGDEAVIKKTIHWR